MNRHIVHIHIIMLLLCVQSAMAEGKRGFWDTPFGHVLKSVDAMLEHGQRSGIDTNYVDIPEQNHQFYLGGYAYWENYRMDHPLQPTEQTAWTNYNIRAHNIQTEMELGISWKGLCVELPVPLHSSFKQSVGLAKNGSVWGFRLRYKHMGNIYGTTDYAIGDEHDEKRLDPNKHMVRMFYAEGYYVLNHRKFSLSSGLYADMVQKRSAGSPLFYINYYQSRYTADSLFLAPHDSYLMQQLSAGVGYGYNYSLLGGRMVLHGSLVPMFSLYTHMKHTNSESQYANGNMYDAVDNGKAAFHMNAFARFACNYSFNRYILSFLLNYRYYAYMNNKDFRIHNQDADAQLNFCVRF